MHVKSVFSVLLNYIVTYNNVIVLKKNHTVDWLL